MDNDIAIKLVVFVILIALTAFFVAAEFAIVKVRSTRIDQLVLEGNKKALRAKKVTNNLDEYLSACQLGITITALGLGWLGKPTIEAILRPLFEMFSLDARISSVVSFIIAFSIVTFLHVVVGELAPKTLAIQQAETVTLQTAGSLILFHNIMYPVIKLLNGSARGLTALFGLKMQSESDVAHSEEELRMILSDSYKSGEINRSEYSFVNRIFEFDDRIAKEIMIPRTEIVSLDQHLSLKEVFDVINVEQYTRYPVVDGDKDHIIGIVNMKQLLTAFILDEKNALKQITHFMQPVIRIIETVPISDLLLKFQLKRIHMAILMDEYGGTSGLVTIEDIIEEIVGDIKDEFDYDELPEVQKIAENHYNLDAKLRLEEVEALLNIDINDEDIDTIGGWFMTNHDRILKGEKHEAEGYEFTIQDINMHQIVRLEVKKVAL
ncbi:hemolysin family protein [Viridibacillus arvi]|uniref:hemolysin family protein n=1 Tax=Viridibacillus arvi TaxID=263475 RepID=UPI003CFD82D5